MIFFAILATLLVVIGFHEMGHAVAARLFGIKIERISIGFGKALLSWRMPDGMLLVWSMWPLGGYVKMLNTRSMPVSSTDTPYCFDKKPIYVRCIVLLAGSLVNIMLAWFLLSFVSMAGHRQLIPVVGEVIPGSAISQAGIQAGDQIVSIERVPVHNWSEAGMRLIGAVGQKSVNITIVTPQKNSRTTTVNLSQFAIKPRHHASFFSALGFQPDVNKIHQIVISPLGFFASLSKAADLLAQWFIFVLIVIKQLLIGAIPLSLLMGPLSLASSAFAAFSAGIVPFIGFLGLLNFFTGLVNLLPIPGLDGASLVYLGIEKWRKKPLSQAFEVLLYRLAMIVFGLLLLQLILNDIQGILENWKAAVT